MEESKIKQNNGVKIAAVVFAVISATFNLWSFFNEFGNNFDFKGAYLRSLVGIAASIVLASSIINNDKKKLANIGLSLILCQIFFSTIINIQLILIMLVHYPFVYEVSGEVFLVVLGTILNIAMAVIPFIAIQMSKNNSRFVNKNTLIALVVVVLIAGFLSAIAIKYVTTNKFYVEEDIAGAYMSIVIGILLCLYLIWYFKYDVEVNDIGNGMNGQNVNLYYTGADENFFAIKIWIHVLLFLFTFGIWTYIWIYRSTRYLNRVENAPKQSPVSQLLLCFIPFYIIYWGYKNAQRTDMLCREHGMTSDLVVPTVLLSIFAAPFAPLPIQSKLNYIVLNESYNRRNQYNAEYNFYCNDNEYNNEYCNNQWNGSKYGNESGNNQYDDNQYRSENCSDQYSQDYSNNQYVNEYSNNQHDDNMNSYQVKQRQQTSNPYEYERVDESNSITNAYEEKTTTEASNQISEADSFSRDIDLIYQYKKLFDDGIITAEEFEKKKKEILGL